MWNERYAEDGFAYGSEPNDFLREALATHRPSSAPITGRALCLAEGEGRNAVWLAQQGWQVRAVDLSAVGLAKAERLAASRGVQIETQVTDLDALELAEGSYELIVSIWAHVPPPLRRRVHTSVARALAPGGLFVLEAYAPANVGRGVGGPQDASLCMRLADLEAELPGLSTVYGVEKERDVNEGKYHVGLSAVTQLVAQR